MLPDVSAHDWISLFKSKDNDIFIMEYRAGSIHMHLEKSFIFCDKKNGSDN